MNDARLPWIALALGAFFALIPLQRFAQALGDTSHWPMHLAAAVLLAAMLGWNLVKKSSNHGPLPWIFYGSLGLALLALSSFWTVDLSAASEARFAFGRYAGYAAAVLVGWRLGLRGLPALAWGILGASAVEALSALGELGQNPKAMLDPYLAPGILGHKNFTSSAMALGLPAAWFLWNRHHGIQRNLSLALGLTVLVAIVVLRTRSIWLGLGLWAVVAVLVNRSSWKALGGAALLGAVVLGGVLARPKARESLVDPTNLRIREVFWGHSLQMLDAHPGTGVGAGQWRVHFPGYGLQGMNPSVAEGVTAEVRPHNDALWLASEHGYPGLIVWAALWLGLGLSIMALRREPGAAFVAGMGLVVFVYSMFEFPLERAAVWIPLMLGAGMLRPDRSAPLAKPLTLGLTGLTAVLLGTYAVAAQRGISAEKTYENLLALNARQDAANLLPAAKSAQNAWTELDRFGNPVPYFAGMSALFLEAQRGPITSSSFAEAEGYFREALALHPHHVVTWYQLGNLYRYRGDAAQAEQAYRELLTRSKRHPGGQMHLAHVLLAQNRPEEAAATLFSAFGDAAYYAQPDYRNAVVQALRQCPDRVAMKGVQNVLNQRAALDDQGLFAAFLAEKQTWL
jgi:O-antigen ligase